MPASTSEELAEVQRLFEQYAASLPIDLNFQGFGTEVATLPGAYAPPPGVLLLAKVNGKAAGCIGLRPWSETIGEVKRLYVAPEYRGLGLARQLITTLITKARELPYEFLVLDTLASMGPAIALHESFGFQGTEPYYANPHGDALYFRMNLAAG